jgi:glycosyltransferase involved in cell wall biosynthesis
MSKHDRYRRPIEPVPQDIERPLWSVMIPTFNCAFYLRETLASVLAQDLGPDRMQIEVVDDCSSDAPDAVVDEFDRGRVSFYRQPEKVGHVGNFNTCIARARGHFVHILHGDDGVRDGFYRTMERPFHDDPEIGAAFCRYISMDSAGNWQAVAALEPDGRGVLEGWLRRIAVGQRLQTPCMVVRRAVYERLRGFDSRLSHCEDWEMWTRIASAYSVYYEPEPLALYRVHERSSSAKSRSSGENVVDLRRAIEINRDVLPDDETEKLTAQALEDTAATAIRRACRMIRAGDEDTARAQVRQALRVSRAPSVLEWLVLYWLVRLRQSVAALSGRSR